jgi:glycosyltransferase involved in cell wall biosynthesis
MIALVVPCYNEEKRLNLDLFAKYASADLHFFFVDDGSKDKTAEMIETYCRKNSFMHLIRLSPNGGKAEAVRRGLLQVPQILKLSDTDWVGFWDGDLATPLFEVSNMLHYSEFYGGVVESIWASRIYRLGSVIRRSPLRHYLGRGFATLIAMLLKVESYDSQCGAKLFQAKLLHKAFDEKFLSNWIFDVEILLRLKGHNIIEYPVREWQDVPGSKVKVLREIPRVFRDILRLRRKYILGRD